mmetsp:Transcript_2398/g.5981  ORF Transcript_2398/g.5981 Transcript_2398/m.5981 type:complete len:204 (+) Transcript_2398:52-663(+)|eukprot:CAMPEP_0183433090 /NCGR_PEP_ID=MMETSP0370-20130417/61154_1 /TAXON_ID=268820 /ORGANISM="Peridinium aciculiferum, Strain PAER-2" /LENGTH=203 /DNA_ID=CAMNT_0025619323 /DNA_START=52 /DNA_END=663 /DNA_ORIENTATION=+
MKFSTLALALGCVPVVVLGHAAPHLDAKQAAEWTCVLPHVATPADAVQADVRLHVHGLASNTTEGQQVVGVDATSLTSLVDAKTEDILIAFYAPWCPHCRNFVMFDDNENPEKALVEILNQEIILEKGPKVVKFDVTKSEVPAQFTVRGIPTVYLSLKSGAAVQYEANPHDLVGLKAWALGGHAMQVLAVKNSTALARGHLRK